MLAFLNATREKVVQMASTVGTFDLCLQCDLIFGYSQEIDDPQYQSDL